MAAKNSKQTVTLTPAPSTSLSNVERFSKATDAVRERVREKKQAGTEAKRFEDRAQDAERRLQKVLERFAQGRGDYSSFAAAIMEMMINTMDVAMVYHNKLYAGTREWQEFAWDKISGPLKNLFEKVLDRVDEWRGKANSDPMGLATVGVKVDEAGKLTISDKMQAGKSGNTIEVELSDEIKQYTMGLFEAFLQNTGKCELVKVDGQDTWVKDQDTGQPLTQEKLEQLLGPDRELYKAFLVEIVKSEVEKDLQKGAPKDDNHPSAPSSVTITRPGSSA